MKLILLYGPPAVGKLSVAEALAASTGFRVLHNYLLIDLSGALFGRSDAARDFTRQLRDISLQAARAAGLKGVIVTFVYARDRDGYILGLCESAEAAGDDVYLIQLTATLETLEARVTEPSRSAYGKLTTVTGLHDTLRRLDEPFGHVGESLILATDSKTPAGVAAGIVRYIGLI